MTERERFEEWAKSEPYLFSDAQLADGSYMDLETRAAWQAWQAARAWRPIESRPKRQKVIFYHPPIDHPSRGRTHEEYIRVDHSDLPFRPATHWQPLTPPPERK